MSGDKGRDFIVLDEFLTDNERDLSDFEGVDFKEQTEAVVEFLTQKKPRLRKFKKFLTESRVKSSNEFWSDGLPIKDLPIEQCFADNNALDDSSLKSNSHEFLASWGEFDTTIFARALNESLGIFDTDQTSHTELHFNMHTSTGKSYQDSLEKVIPIYEKNFNKYATVTVLIPTTKNPKENPTTENPKEKVSENIPVWTFHHTEYKDKQSLGLRLFTVLSFLGISTSEKKGIWYRLIKHFLLPVSYVENDGRGTTCGTRFEQVKRGGSDLYLLFKGRKSKTVKFKDKSYTPENITLATSGHSETKLPHGRYELITAVNELMMFTSGTAITIKVKVENNESHQPPIIIAPKKWVDALGNCTSPGVIDFNDMFYKEKIPPVCSYLFKENYAYSDPWRRFHKDHKYFSPSEEKNNGLLERIIPR